MLYLAEKHVETNIASTAIRLLPQNATNSDFFNSLPKNCIVDQRMNRVDTLFKRTI